MGTRIKTPLEVYVLFHKDFMEGHAIYKQMYHLLCRNPEAPLTDGIDIPVLLRIGGDKIAIPEINYEQSTKTAILLLVDEHMYCCPLWKEYIGRLVAIKSSNVKLFPISLFKYAFDINKKIGKKQFISFPDNSILNNWEAFKTRLFDNLIRLLEDKENTKLKLFISHSKKDKSNLGEETAKGLREFIRRDTKLDSFFDANDIIDSYDFGEQIKQGINESLLIILKTDTYSEREWCKIEALAGKKGKIPTVVVSMINGTVKRNFPYLGNTPLIGFNNNWQDILNLLLSTALNQYYQKQLLTEINRITGDSFSLLPNTPELLSFIGLGEKTEVLYPEPPLGNEEIEFLKQFKDDISFITPMQIYSKLGTNLKDKNIAISISESEDIRDFGADETLLRDISIEISRHILVAGGNLIYGGDLRSQGYTDLFQNLSCQYGISEKIDRETKYFTNYFAWPIHLNLYQTHRAEFEHSRVAIVEVEAPDECPSESKSTFLSPNTVENNFLWAKSLTKMRKEMENNTHARVILGGRLAGFKGKYAGIVEEFLMSKQENHPIYLIGGFGGASRAIADILQGKNLNNIEESPNQDAYYKELVKYYNTKSKTDKIDYIVLVEGIKFGGIASLNNGLNDEENKILFETTNIIEIVALIMKGLSNKFKNN